MKNTLRTGIAVGLIAAFSFTNTAIAETDLSNDDAKKSYSLGMMIGDRITKRYGDLDYDALLDGIRAQHEGAETAMSIDEAQAALQEFEQKATEAASSEARAEGETYLTENMKKDGVMVTESGLQYEVVTGGEGEKPVATDTVSVHYVGTLINGKEFDSSVARGQPAEFPLNGVIPGWTEGLQLMNVGSKYRFVIPSELAYGERGAGADIPPGATLIFEVELLEIK